MLGECVADAFVTAADIGGLGLRVRPGGGPANTAAALARLGTPTRFLGRLSADVFGRLFRTRLTDAGVDLDAVVEAAEPSTLAVADVDDRGRADYSFHAQGTADWQWTDTELARAARAPLACLHTGSLALVRAPGDAAVERLAAAVRARATVSLDPNVRPLLVEPARYRERLARWCAVTDVLRLSDEDLAHLLPGTPLPRAAETFHAWGARLVVVTLGERGAYASLDGRGVRVAAPAVAVADTVGAGDAFMAGFLHALHGGGALGGRLDGLDEAAVRSALARGVEVAAAVCTVRGADLPRTGPA
ncbi:PfkB family carbohydrate kinase [Streptomyces sp. JJ38]|uniref:PfkB family carbohydrate kinase n=1 Tax=Streptomyces sp. JJ38 TaxID=2738128 RepID=UPI0027DFDE01|nr:PfkB family carbohydrate kinase [Streptomyces sp. JJ38]